ncbi:hypothetical protein D9756_009019 [Leucocoprinus leucothites]|uniref:Protein kinase domain-containing protein n=1 Tax=Leucocoprinus leucothites TaxID=201217 RepID=A0A8H5FUM3_9AGAR|nr:hypothetical protein D9756_009019 [Leucoagaricus leucothites]
MAVHHIHSRPLPLPPSSPASSARSSSASKTHAFFASTGASTDAPSMSNESSTTPTPPRSLTADFFSTPVRTPSPPPTTRSTKAASILAAIHPSRIFPSRYTSRAHRDDDDDLPEPVYQQQPPTDPGLMFLELNDQGLSLMPSPYTQPPRALSSLSSLSTSSSSDSHSSSQIIPESSSIPSTRLPTPPPPPEQSGTSNSNATPRPTHLEPSFTTSPAAKLSGTTTAIDNDDEDPAPGCVITTHPTPRISSNEDSPTFTITPPPNSTTFPHHVTSAPPPPPQSQDKTKLHLLRPLGQGAFSSVWLAEDHSRLPLTLKSKKSIRELRRKASLSSRSRKSSIRSARSVSGGAGGTSHATPAIEDLTSLGRDGSLRMRNLRARVKGTRPVGFNTHFLDERHGEMGKRTGSSEAHTGVLSSDGEHSSSMIFSPPLSASNSTSSADGGSGSGALTLRGLGFLGGRVTPVKAPRKKSRKARLVAVKMTPRRALGFVNPSGRDEEEEEERTRVGFVREVEILKHISHPNITVLLEHMSTPSYHILVLPYLPGGDLLGLVNNDIAWSKLGESVLRRIWCELCKAVGWMHGVGLVHRDIKLENILLTTHAFSSLTPTSPRPTLATLPETPRPLIKLTDFGLSRFIEIDELTGEGELLWTRCGSEAYAAPELVMGTGSVRAQAQADARRRRRRRPSGTAGVDHHKEEEEEEGVRGFYDARETDAWACGVVLYALVGRRLPFGEGVMGGNGGGGGRIGGDGAPGHGHGRASAVERRQWLMRIARGEYEWSDKMPELSSNLNSTSVTDDEELIGQQLIHSEGAKRIVGKLLVRDPRKRARIMDLWEDGWMWGLGGGLAVGMTEEEWRESERERMHASSSAGIGLGIDFGGEGSNELDSSLSAFAGPDGNVGDAGGWGVAEQPGSEEVTIDVDYANEEHIWDEGMVEEVGEEHHDPVDGDCDRDGEGEVEVEVEEEEVDGEEGWLLDQEGIGSVARQEVV